MKRATLKCEIEYYYEGDAGGLLMTDPKQVWIVLPDNDLFELTGECGDDIKDHLWVSGGFLYMAKIEDNVSLPRNEKSNE